MGDQNLIAGARDSNMEVEKSMEWLPGFENDLDDLFIMDLHLLKLMNNLFLKKCISVSINI